MPLARCSCLVTALGHKPHSGKRLESLTNLSLILGVVLARSAYLRPHSPTDFSVTMIFLSPKSDSVSSFLHGLKTQLRGQDISPLIQPETHFNTEFDFEIGILLSKIWVLYLHIYCS